MISDKLFVTTVSTLVANDEKKMLPAIRVDGENRIEGAWTKLVDAESQLSCYCYVSFNRGKFFRSTWNVL